MSSTPFPWHRFATIAALAEKAPAGRFGRTALMKYAYFLQVLRQLPLGYDFTLYAYGPFDGEVLNDLDYTKTLGAVEVKTVHYPNGYGYDIRPGEMAEEIKAKAADFLTAHEQNLDWVVAEFGSLSSAQLELASTMIYVDREAERSAETVSLDELTRRVLEIKPKFSPEYARTQAETLREKGLLVSIQK